MTTGGFMALHLMVDQPEMYSSPIQAQVAYFDKEQTAWVKCSGTFWCTRFHISCQTTKLRKGQIVTVLGRLGNSLLITTVV
jgi:hypothetical protein